MHGRTNYWWGSVPRHMEPLSFRVICSHFCPCVCVCVCGRRAVWNKRMFWTNVSRDNGTFPSHNVFNGATAHVYVHKECFTRREGEREVRGDSQGKWERGRRGAFLETTNSARDEGAFVVHVQYLLWAVSNSSCRCVHRARANARLNLEYVNVSRLWFVWVYIDRVVCVCVGYPRSRSGWTAEIHMPSSYHSALD